VGGGEGREEEENEEERGSHGSKVRCSSVCLSEVKRVESVNGEVEGLFRWEGMLWLLHVLGPSFVQKMCFFLICLLLHLFALGE
jgi:hypothetical protein